MALLEHYRPFHICQALKINANTLKQWSVAMDRESEPATTTFVALPEPLGTDSSLISNQSMITAVWPGGIRIHTENPIALAQALNAMRELAR